MEDTPLTFVSTVTELSSVIDKLRKEHIVAVDLEVSMSLEFLINKLDIHMVHESSWTETHCEMYDFVFMCISMCQSYIVKNAKSLLYYGFEF